jgi:hypothetical protein
MSTNSILTGILGLAAGAAVTYFAISPSQIEASSPLSTNSPIQITSVSAPPPCLATSKNISTGDANAFVTAYIASANHLKSGSANLKGWYLERCVIEGMFSDFPIADGIQLYVGQMPNGDNNLVWVASKDTIINDENQRENILASNSIYDYSSRCPIVCPTKNDFPN